MISQSEALDIVLEHRITFPSESVPLAQAIGRVLDEDVLADRPFPPFDRVCMDGIAIAYAAFSAGHRSFTKEAMAAAGDPQLTLRDASACIEIMTGAIVPEGCDTIIRYEDLEATDEGFNILCDVKQGQNIHYKGEDSAAGDLILQRGSRIKAIDINILASVGKSSVQVKALPRVTVISSGEELVPVDETPLPHQIRRSNVHMLLARLKEYGITAHEFHLQDEQEDIRVKVSSILEEHDVLLLSGGVSKGKFDFIPDVLEELGIEKHFHFVKQRPGKPFWFGSKEEKRVFAFPGNPVSTLACFHGYFIPWLYAGLGLAYTPMKVKLASDVHFKPALSYFAQAHIWQDEETVTWAEVQHGGGSGDMLSPSQMDGFVLLPPNLVTFPKGMVVEFYRF